jgi:transcriptional regulator with XRE-family HTH domain
MTPIATKGGAGELLREWRNRRRMSQLDLALEANVSARHLSFVETGHSQPSRELLLSLAEYLRSMRSPRSPQATARTCSSAGSRATGADGKPIEQTGVDRIKVRDGKVVENRIFFDRREVERKLGRSLAL